MKIRTALVLAVLAVVCLEHVHGAFGSGGDRVLLTDIKTLTLYSGQMTQGRRSAPVPQLKCVSGSAAGQFVPQVVQCYNRGSDGYDIQWECKTDMDNAFRFGQVQVTCEGYDYPDDPYVLRGSCGLEYTLEYTKEGFAQQQGSHQYYHGDSSFHDRSHQYYKSYKMGGGLSNLIGLVIVCLIIYGIYKTCLAGAAQGDAGSGGGHTNTMGFGGRSSQPPPPGFRPEYMPGPDSCGSTFAAGGTTGAADSTGGGGFWTGAATGGLLGYLLGRNNSGYTAYHQAPPTSSWFGSGWGGGYSRPASTSWFSSSGSSSRSSPSSGTRTASGFGGTKRR